MSRFSSILVPAALLATLCLLLLPGSAARPDSAAAADCSLGNTGTLIIRIIDAATNAPLETDSTQVLIKPDPRDFILDEVVHDTAIPDASNARDRESDTGVIRIEDACSTEGAESYTAELYALPETLEDCDTEEDSDSTKLEADETETLILVVDCTGVGPTPVATVTTTPGPAATVIASTSPISVGCNGTAIINIAVRDSAGKPVAAGTSVLITTTLGSVTGPNQVTTSGGAVTTFFAAPSAAGGTAVITARSGSVTGTASVGVNCGGAGGTTTAPPPTVAPVGGGGVITPPNTGDGGLAASQGWTTVALLLVAGGTLGGLAFARVRRR